ncbi:MAG: hypothetical protein HYV07_26120 [Deltaproteobacteria bacterium]|nr:hypothetical protein [Deltaproteobacteria bacterium]
MTLGLRGPFWFGLCFAAVVAGCAKATECASNKDCALGQSCISGVCKLVATKDCQTDVDCPLGERCSLDGLCEADVPGADGSVADDGSEGADRMSSDAIAFDAVIDAGSFDASAPSLDATPTDAAPTIPDAGPCSRDDECGTPPQAICAGGACTRGCNQPQGIGCGTGTNCDPISGHCVATACAEDGDCLPPSFVCESTRCVVGCTRAGGLTCNDMTQACDPDAGRCVAGNFALGAACARDLECASGSCITLPSATGGRRVCTKACSSTRECPVHFTCGDVSGMRLCQGEDLVSPPASYLTPSGGLCTATSNQCQSTWCNTSQNTCREACSRNADCFAFGDNCSAFVMTQASVTVYEDLCLSPAGAAHGAACARHADCQSGVCDPAARACARLCCGEGDCEASESCVSMTLDATAGEARRACRARTPTAGNLSLGAACVAGPDCESETCAPADFASPNGAKRCSTSCCNDTDCDALPNGGRCRPLPGPVIGGRQTQVGVCDPT